MNKVLREICGHIQFRRIQGFGENVLCQQIQRLCTKTTSQNLEQKRREIMARGLPKQKPIDGVKHIIVVSSGKGGVGKSTIAVNLAAAMKVFYPAKKVGLLDTDVFGPSIPLMMNLNETPLLTDNNLMEPLVNYGIKCMSMGFLIEKGAPIIWRGLMVMQALQKLIREVHWGELDYLIVDTPPGTGDTHLSLIQNVPINGVLLVTTSQIASLEVTRRGAAMFQKLNVPIIGMIENMSYITCDSCYKELKVFGDDTTKLASEITCDILAQFPLNQEMSNSAGKGVPIVIHDKNNVCSEMYKNLAKKVVHYLKNNKS